ncbi:MAG: hypothetical protein AB3N16_01790 [Flavobacteriaceae bacterium]
MLKTIALKVTALIFFGIMGCQAQQINDLTKMFSVAQLHEDIRVLERELKSNHPGLYTYTSPMEMDSVFNALNQSVAEGMNTMRFYRRLAVLNSVIKDSRTKVRVPRPYQRVLDDSLPCFPFSLHYQGLSKFGKQKTPPYVEGQYCSKRLGQWYWGNISLVKRNRRPQV